MSKTNRRSFLKALGLGAPIAAVGAAKAITTPEQTSITTGFGWLTDDGEFGSGLFTRETFSTDGKVVIKETMNFDSKKQASIYDRLNRKG